MMNEQVRNYFKSRRLQTARDLFREQHCITVQPEGPYLYLVAEGVGEGVKIPITEEDRKFVHRVQFLFRKQGGAADSLPQGWRILATKYALLAPEPLHTYVAKWDNAEGRLKIYEQRRIGRSPRTEDHHVADVNNEMREVYAKANNKGFDSKSGQVEGMPQSRETDEQIAKWWMEENKDCLHSYGSDPPSPQVKIVMRGQTRVTLAFRAKTKEKYGTKWKYQWITVKDIPINMEQFHKHAQDHGFDELLHGGHVVRMTPTKWQSMIEPEFTGSGGSKPNEALRKAGKAGFDVAHPKLKDMLIKPTKDGGLSVAEIKKLIDEKNPELQLSLNDEGKGEAFYKGVKVAKIIAPGYITPGHHERDRDSSEEFGRQYSNDREFRRLIDNYIKASVIAALKRHNKKPEGDLVKELFNATFERFIGRTSRIPDNDWANWKELLGDPDKWVCGKKTASQNTPFGNALCGLIGGSAQTEVKQHFGLHRAGGEMGTIASGAGGQTDQRPDATHQAVFDPSRDERMDIQSLTTPEALLAYIRDNTSAIRDPAVQQKIRQMAAGNPILTQIAQGLDKLHGQAAEQPPEEEPYGDFDDEYDDDEHSGTMGRYDPRMARREEVSPYSFRSYFQRRLNEMGVVWGNDKASARRLKPHQTLKGGIQVFGAPWTAGGGPNYKDNDVKVKG